MKLIRQAYRTFLGTDKMAHTAYAEVGMYLDVDGIEKWRGEAKVDAGFVGDNLSKRDAQYALAMALRSLADKVESDE